MEKTDFFELSVGAKKNVNIVVAYWDKDLICRFANDGIVAWFGIKPDDMINKMHIKQVLGPLYDENLPYIKAALRGEEQSFERTILSPNGKLIKAHVKYYPDVADGTAKGFFVHALNASPLVTDNNVDEAVITINDYSAAAEKTLKNVAETLKDHILRQFPGIRYLSKKHFISESKLKRDFKQKYNATIFNYYRELQMKLAYQYITEKKYNKSQVAALFNFSNPSNFSACYQKYLDENVARHLMEKIKKEHADRYKIFIEQTPVAIAMVDNGLRFLAASKKWVSDYNLYDKEFIDKCLYDVFAGSEMIYSDMFSACLNGDINKCDAEFVNRLDGRPAWMRWDIRPWYSDDGKIGGLSIFTEDITAQKLKEDEIVELSSILIKSKGVDRIGVWQRNFKTNVSIWSKTLKEILEVPHDSEPTNLKYGLQFYKEGPDRELAERLIANAVKKGVNFDFETRIITAKGKLIKALVTGYPEFVNGECLKISGILQEIVNIPNSHQDSLNENVRLMPVARGKVG